MKKLFFILFFVGMFCHAQSVSLVAKSSLKGKITITRAPFYDTKDYNFEIGNNEPFVKKTLSSEITPVTVEFNEKIVFAFAHPDRDLQIIFLKDKNNQMDYSFPENDIVNHFSKQFHEMMFGKVKEKGGIQYIVKNIDAISAEQFAKLERIRKEITPEEYAVLKAVLTGRFLTFKTAKYHKQKDRVAKIYEQLFNGGKFLEKFFGVSR